MTASVVVPGHPTSCICCNVGFQSPMAEEVRGEELGEDEAGALDFFSSTDSSDSAETFLSAKTRANMVKYLIDKIGQFSDIEKEEIKE